jgi:hypothetical protein
MTDDGGRWVRIPAALRDELAEAARSGSQPAVATLVDLYDRARPEDWIAQLVRVNRELAGELRRMQASAVSAADPGSRSA